MSAIPQFYPPALRTLNASKTKKIELIFGFFYTEGIF